MMNLRQDWPPGSASCARRSWSCAVGLLLLSNHSVLAFLSTNAFHRPVFHSTNDTTTATALYVHTERSPDMMEMMMGGERYEMIPLPDSMVSTTLFVGNLDEFIHDEDLSNLFQSVTPNMSSVPACVVRKPNMNSLCYGFVTFQRPEEKEAAILQYNGYEWRGKRIKVEPIRDDPGQNRVRVPERMVSFCAGAVKKTRAGRTNNLRRISRDEKMDRLPGRRRPSKKKLHGDRNVPYRLSDSERAELDRAATRGYVTLTWSKRQTYRTSSLAKAHRQSCDARARPHIVLFKATGGRALDHVMVDLSPIRLHGLFEVSQVEEFLVKWKADIWTAATDAGMTICSDLDESEEVDDIAEFDPSEMMLTVDETVTREAWARQPIGNLPVQSIGKFEGIRSSAKAMVKELARLWDVAEDDGHTGFRTRTKHKFPKKRDHHRKRGGGHRQAF